ncbi:MAG: pentapeptide repeat-containing protein [Haloarculaceae archaeon]
MGDRCRFVPDVTADTDRGRLCCWRETFEDADRCVWHLDRGDRALTDFSAPQPGERLDGAIMRGLSLNGVDWLAECVLVGADFSDANVSRASFVGADLREATFHAADARGTSFERANLESATMTDVDLRDADFSKAQFDVADFSSSRINEHTVFSDRCVYERDIVDPAADVPATDALDAAVRTYRCLEDLSQENTLYAQASRYYRMSKDVRRRYNWAAGNYVHALVGEASRWFTGYGNRPWRVLQTSTAIAALSALAYPLVGGVSPAGDPGGPVYSAATAGGAHGWLAVAGKSLYFSVVTFTTLGYGNLAPVSAVGRTIAAAEAILGSVFLALLVAVLTRSTWLR